MKRETEAQRFARESIELTPLRPTNRDTLAAAIRADERELSRLRTKGFRPLKPGHIHMRCWICGRKMSNAKRAEYDHPTAFLMETCCPNCCEGHKHDMGSADYFDKRGRELKWPRR